MTEMARLEKIRGRLAAIAPGDWTLAADGEATFVEAKDEMGVPCRLLDFRAGAASDEMAFVVAAPDDMRFLLGLVDRAIARARQSAVSSGQSGQGPNAELPNADNRDYAAEAAMKCQEPAFKAFLEERHGLERPLTDDRAAQKLRSLLGVTSRRELNQSGDAAARWKRLRADFYQWREAS